MGKKLFILLKVENKIEIILKERIGAVAKLDNFVYIFFFNNFICTEFYKT